MTERAREHVASAARGIALTTGELGTSEAHAKWSEVLNELYGCMDVAWPRDQRWDAEWGGHQFGDLHVSNIRAQSHTVHRTREMIQASADPDYLLIMVTNGHVEVRQSGRTSVLDNGAFAVLDCAVPFVFQALADFDQVVVRAPRDVLDARLPRRTLDDLTARPIAGGSGTGGLFGHLVRQIAALNAPIPEGSAMAVGASALDILVAALAEGPATIGTTKLNHLEDLAHVKRTIERHMHDPEYTLSDLSNQVGMSLRHIQKLFNGEDTTPRAWLYQSRLERARRYLVATSLTVAEISERVGFRDASHFSRTFRDRFAVSPGQYRKDHGRGDAPKPR